MLHIGNKLPDKRWVDYLQQNLLIGAKTLTRRQTTRQQAKRFNRVFLWLAKRYKRANRPLLIAQDTKYCFNGASIRLQKVQPLKSKDNGLLGLFIVQADMCSGCLNRLVPCVMLQKHTVVGVLTGDKIKVGNKCEIRVPNYLTNSLVNLEIDERSKRLK